MKKLKSFKVFLEPQSFKLNQFEKLYFRQIAVEEVFPQIQEFSIENYRALLRKIYKNKNIRVGRYIAKRRKTLHKLHPYEFYEKNIQYSRSNGKAVKYILEGFPPKKAEFLAKSWLEKISYGQSLEFYMKKFGEKEGLKKYKEIILIKG